jgi:hypothetical protein
MTCVYVVFLEYDRYLPNSDSSFPSNSTSIQQVEHLELVSDRFNWTWAPDNMGDADNSVVAWGLVKFKREAHRRSAAQYRWRLVLLPYAYDFALIHFQKWGGTAGKGSNPHGRVWWCSSHCSHLFSISRHRQRVKKDNNEIESRKEQARKADRRYRQKYGFFWATTWKRLMFS